MEWTEWCRLCAKEKGNQIDIFIKNENYSNISETIQKHLLITINHYEEIPTKICSACNEFLLALLSFADKTNKVQQMFLELEYLMKLETHFNLTELRIKYGFENAHCIRSNQHILKQEGNDEETELILTRKRKITKRHNRKSTRNLSSYVTNLSDCKEIVTENNKNNDSEGIKNEIENATENIIELDEVKKENDTISYKNMIDNGNSDFDNCSENNNSVDDTEYKPQNSYSVKIKEVPNSKLRNKKFVCYKTQSDDNPKRIKKKYKDEEKRIQCEMCPMKFVRENNLSAHLKKAHKVVKELPPCEYCGKICKTKQKLKFHRELHLPSEERQKLLFKCPLCDQKFTQKGAMRSHIRGTHSHERPFICEACGKAFTSQSNLWAHRKKTHEENMMPCDVCQKICKNSSSLRKHMGTHKEPSIPCAVCGILLKTKKTLKNHMLVHSDIKAFQCNYCGKEFKRDITLQLHMIIHSGLKPYVCRFCEQTYANPSNCKKHEKHSHPMEYQAAEGENGPSQPQRILKKLPNIKQLKAMLEDMKAAKEKS